MLDELAFEVCGAEELEREMAGVLDLQQRLLTPDRDRNADYLRWKYWANPAGADSFVVLARWRGGLVGMRGFMGHRWRVGAGQPLTMPLGGDTVVSPAVEGRGVVRAMNRVAVEECRRRGYPFLMNMGAGWAIRLASLRSGWREAARADLFTRQPRMHADRRDEMASGAGTSVMGMRVKVESSLSHDVMSELTGLARPPRRPVTAVEGPSYWAWRLRPPLSHYEFLVASAGGRVAGAVVMARAWYDTPGSIHAAHWMVRDETVLCCLLRAVSEAYASREISLWANGFEAGEVSVARSLGFAPFVESRGAGMPQPAILLHPCDSDAPDAFIVNGIDLLDGSNWEFQMLSSDAL